MRITTTTTANTEQRQQQQQDEHYEHIIGHYYSVYFYYKTFFFSLFLSLLCFCMEMFGVFPHCLHIFMHVLTCIHCTCVASKFISISFFQINKLSLLLHCLYSLQLSR